MSNPPSPKPDDHAPRQPVASPRASVLWARWAWIVNVACLVALLAWILGDPGLERFGAEIDNQSVANALRPFPSSLTRWLELVTRSTGQRVYWFGALALVACVSSGMVLLSLVRGGPKDRTLRRWFVFIALVGVWVTVARSWGDLSWFGKALRLRDDVAALQPIAERLKADWPTDADFRFEGLGSINAYPHGDSTTLMLLTPPHLAGREGSLTKVYRTDQGAICFELSSPGVDDCMVWLPDGSPPASFEDGLRQNHRLQKFRRIKGNWYLARYLYGRWIE